METQNIKRLVVLGGGESGVGAAILAKDKGMDVFLSDFGSIAPAIRKCCAKRTYPLRKDNTPWSAYSPPTRW